ncbi:MAG: hypothetical protein KAR39_01630 [Thermoplasmata archaeon]|nr:hypothetical protein [Thermoplasmata archaeon]
MKGTEYEDYRMEKSKYIGSTIFYIGAILLCMGLAFSYILSYDIDTSYGQELGYVWVPTATDLSKILVIVGTAMVFIGGVWAIDVGWYINKKRAEEFWATHKK